MRKCVFKATLLYPNQIGFRLIFRLFIFGKTCQNIFSLSFPLIFKSVLIYREMNC